jgi:uncharacterized protein
MTLQHRNIDFGMRTALPRYWLGGDCHRTRFYDAMSIMFPEGERAFMESVQFYRAQLADDPALARDAAEFVAQEALHTRGHARYNARLKAQGAPIEKLEALGARQQDFVRRALSPHARLAFTICLEHYTAMLADQILRHPHALDGADPAMADLWRWHALEEIEHKAVAFDVYSAVVPGRIRRYLLRCAVMLVVTLFFTTLLWRITFSLIRYDGRATDLKGWMRLLREQFIAPGALTRMVPKWFAWFAPGFHPWRQDNRELIARFAPWFDRKARGSHQRFVRDPSLRS